MPGARELEPKTRVITLVRRIRGRPQIVLDAVTGERQLCSLDPKSVDYVQADGNLTLRGRRPLFIPRMDGFITMAALVIPKWLRPFALLLLFRDEFR